MTETIQKNWLNNFLGELKHSAQANLISPFITSTTVDHLIENKQSADIKIITRFNLNDFRLKVSSLFALRKLVLNGIKVIGIKNLHSKVYIFDNSVIIGSANFTSGGFFHNFEYGIKSIDKEIILQSQKYFHELWTLNTEYLTLEKIDEWEKMIKLLGPLNPKDELPDYGVRASIQGTKSRKFFIKFFGKGDNRVSLNHESKMEIERSHCHWALTFSGKRGRPRKYNDGDIVYMARMLEGNDYAIFGKGIALNHVDNRDIASSEDIKNIDWKSDWPIYIRVRDVEFIDGIMKDCPLMSNLLKTLKFESFFNTQNRYLNGQENFNVKDSLRRQADIQLSEISAEWLESKFQEAKLTKGILSKQYLDTLYQGNPTLAEILN